MSDKFRAYLDLIRIPNVFTAFADVVAGFLYVGGTAGNWRTAILLAVASGCLYAGGCALNDVCDVARDTRERPNRPIPSGRVTRRAALALSVFLCSLGIGAAAGISGRAALTAILLAGAVVLYDAVFKRTVLAPGLMGTCRALNLALGMSGAQTLWSGTTLVPIVLMWLYVTSVTHFARREAEGGGRGRLVAGAVGVSLAVVGLTSLCRLVHAVHVEYLAAATLLALWLGYRGLTAVVHPKPASVQRTVRTFVISIILFDMCIVWAARGPGTALLVAVLLLPTLWLGRRFRVT